MKISFPDKQTAQSWQDAKHAAMRASNSQYDRSCKDYESWHKNPVGINPGGTRCWADPVPDLAADGKTLLSSSYLIPVNAQVASVLTAADVQAFPSLSVLVTPVVEAVVIGE